MAESILNDTKKVLNLAPAYTAFDLDIIMFINSAFVVLNQLGVGPEEGFAIEDDTQTWDDFVLLEGTGSTIAMVKTYVYLKVRMLFDPPTTSYLIEARQKQIEEHEFRLNLSREEVLHPITEEEVIA